MSEPAKQRSRSRQATRQRWAERLACFPNAGLSVAAFCAAERVSVPSFFYWKRRLAAAPPAATPDAEPRFFPVHLQPPPTPVEVVLPNGTLLRLHPGCDP